jgi:cytoskeleton protein RodZ
VTEARTVGDILRAARRRRRVSIERAADETRIRADYLMRMESDEFDFLAPAYVRGFLRSYARWLGLEPSPLVADFDRRFGVGRTDTGQIAALERRGRNVARQRKRPSSWAVAATLAAIVMVALGVIGYTSNPSGQAPGQDEIAGLGDSASPEPTEEPTSEPTPRATPTRSPKDNVIAFTDGIRLQVVASRAECWVDVTADGAGVYAQVLGVGQRAGPFSAETSMDIVLGNAYGVDLIVNGRKVPGPFGPSGDVVTISLPEDIRSLL